MINNIEKLENYLKSLSTNRLKKLLEQYIWEQNNGLENHTEKIAIFNKIISEKH